MKPYHCCYCNKSFVQKDYLKVHQRSHTGENPYHCSQCDKTFTTKANLNKHQTIHTYEKTYQCSDCNKAFALKTILKYTKEITQGRNHIIAANVTKLLCKKNLN